MTCALVAQLRLASWVPPSKSAANLGLDLSEIALLAFGALLVFGLVGEYTESEKWKKHVKAFELCVIVGVLGELIGDAGVFLFSARLQTISQAEIAELNKAANTAKERAEEAGRETAKLQEQATKANGENLRLQVSIQPRSLSLEQQRDIGKALLPFKGRKVLISVISLNDPESYNFALQILASLRAAKLDVELSASSPTGTQYSAVAETGVQVRWPLGQRDLGIALGIALHKTGHVRELSVVQGTAFGPVQTEFVPKTVGISVFPKPFVVLP
jgi:hypothetical protein